MTYEQILKEKGTVDKALDYLFWVQGNNISKWKEKVPQKSYLDTQIYKYWHSMIDQFTWAKEGEVMGIESTVPF